MVDPSDTLQSSNTYSWRDAFPVSWRIAIIYLLLGFTWILLSDKLLIWFINDPQALTIAQTYKGWFFILITAILVWGLVRQYERQLNKTMHLLQEKNRLLEAEIDEHKKNKAELYDALTEKEAMLQEIFHRVYNNLQLISSMIQLQKKSAVNDDTRKVLEEMYHRIRNFSHIHQRVYTNVHLSRIPLKSYLNTLITHVLQPFRDAQQSIGFTLHISPTFALHVKSAIPISIMLCELISDCGENSLANTENAAIDITFLELESHYQMQISDNGSGIVDDWHSEEDSSMSHTIIKALSQQIHGTITCDSANGTRFSVIFEDVQ
jgi:two-component sensor histidine kinase